MLGRIGLGGDRLEEFVDQVKPARPGDGQRDQVDRVYPAPPGAPPEVAGLGLADAALVAEVVVIDRGGRHPPAVVAEPSPEGPVVVRDVATCVRGKDRPAADLQQRVGPDQGRHARDVGAAEEVGVPGVTPSIALRAAELDSGVGGGGSAVGLDRRQQDLEVVRRDHIVVVEETEVGQIAQLPEADIAGRVATLAVADANADMLDAGIAADDLFGRLVAVVDDEHSLGTVRLHPERAEHVRQQGRSIAGRDHHPNAARERAAGEPGRRLGLRSGPALGPKVRGPCSVSGVGVSMRADVPEVSGVGACREDASIWILASSGDGGIRVRCPWLHWMTLLAAQGHSCQAGSDEMCPRDRRPF